EYDTRAVIGVEAFATLIASLCGGVIQTTPYIGHPAYKAMGGRAAYTLATALFVGSAGLLGFFGYLYAIIPKATVFPILIFIGIEITSQSFKATDRKHYPAVVIACIPALASLAFLFVDKMLGDLIPSGITLENLSETMQGEIQTLRILANGFILTSLVWASAVAAMIDRKLKTSAIYFLVAAGFTLFGLMHSPLPGAPVFWPWMLEQDVLMQVLRFTVGYSVVAATLFAWSNFVEEAEIKS
ncbi:MAG: permease, partial [Planctomycetota bacterium]